MNTTTHDNSAPLPAGAETRFDWESDQPPHQPYRVISGRTRTLNDGRGEVETSALQYAVASINTTDDPPRISVTTYTDDGLTSGEARDLAAMLIEAADEGRPVGGFEMTTPTYPDLPDPAGAVHVAEWDDMHSIDDGRRYFRGTSRVIERDGDIDADITVEIYGTQGGAGDVIRRIMVSEDNRDTLELSSSDHARQLGRALIAAADEAEQMNGYDEIVVS
jgi:hypothetical protein